MLGADAFDLMGVLFLSLVHSLQSAAICRAFLDAKRSEGRIFSRPSQSLLLFPSSPAISLAILSILVGLFVNVRFFSQKLRFNDFIDETFEL